MKLCEDTKNRSAIPRYTNAVEVKFQGTIPRSKWWAFPLFQEEFEITKEFLTSQDFLAHVFYTVNDLHARSRRTKKERAQAFAKRPKWGVDVQFADILVWGANNYNRGGIHIAFIYLSIFF